MNRLWKYLRENFSPELMIQVYNLYEIDFDVPLALTYGSAKIASQNDEEAIFMLQEKLNRVGLGNMEINRSQICGKHRDAKVLGIEYHHALYPDDVLAMRKRNEKRGWTY